MLPAKHPLHLRDSNPIAIAVSRSRYTPQKIKSSLQSSFPVIFKAYIEALVSEETKDELERKFIVRDFID